MNIKEAAQDWNVSEKTVMNYILKGYIYNLAIENNEIVFPEIPKPYVNGYLRKWIRGISIYWML